ncbi:MAG: glycoside hydrolase family 3 N-terminal domain-containing protein [Gemmatimonadaceae bacterium]
MHARRLASLMAIAALVAASCGRIRPAATVSPDVTRATTPRFTPSLTASLNDEARAWIEQTLAGLTLRQKVGQMTSAWVLGDYTSTSDPSFVEIRDWIVKDEVGSVTMSLGTPIEVAAKLNDLQKLAKIPLLVHSDLEPNLGRLEGGIFAPYAYGAGSATVIPANMAIGATGDTALARRAGEIIGREAMAVGINVVFAPTVDVNNNPANPVINTRSFGEDPQQVAQLSAAFVRGVQSSGAIATIKHFPGHGDTDTDSHLALPVVKSNRARLDQVELVPFRAAIKAGAMAVMSAHIALPAIGQDNAPATLRKDVITGLLRDTLGFTGVAYTDALSMEGIGGGYTVEKSAVAAVLAGADVLLKPTHIGRAIDAVVAAVERGEIPVSRIDASVRRLLEHKLRVGVIQRPFVSLEALRDTVGAAEHRKLAAEIAQKAVTLVRDRGNLVPLARGIPTLVLTYAPEQDISAGRTFATALRGALGGRTRAQRVGARTPRSELDSLGQGAERVVFSTHGRTIEGEGKLAIAPQVAQWLDSVAAVRPVVMVSHGNPYVIRQFRNVGTYAMAFGTGATMESASALAMAGLRPISGRSPISLPGFYARGDGIPRALPFPREALPTVMKDSLQHLLDRAVHDSAFPGAVAIVGRKDRVLATVSAGRLDWKEATTPDENTLWDMASLTKVTATTSSIMRLVDAGKVDINAPVQKYLPDWQGKNKEKVLIRHLLTHSSGLISWRPIYKEATSPEQGIQLVLQTQLDTLPGARMLYSDLNFILLGLIVQRVSGLPLDAFVREQVFGPLKMTDTQFNPDKSLLPRIAPTEIDPWRGRHIRGEVHDENAFTLGGVSGHAGLFSTAHDVGRLCQAYLNGGTLDGVRVWSPETIKLFTTVYDSTFSNRALGWETPNGMNSAGRIMRRPAFGHTGFTGTSIWIDPANDLFVVLLTNRVNPTRQNSKIGGVRQAVADMAEELLAASKR